MTASQVANAITIIAGFVALGVFFDQILITPETRDRIRTFLQRRTTTRAWSETFFEFVELIYEAVFFRFFRARMYSLGYFLRCSFLSLLSLLVILALQIHFYGLGELVDLELTQAQIVILSLCVAFNLVIDWASIAQTQIFFEISTEQKRVGRTLLLIGSDFVLTINLFTLLYSQLITYIIIANMIPSVNIKIEASFRSRSIPTSDQARYKDVGVTSDRPLFDTTLAIRPSATDQSERLRSTIVHILTDTESFNLDDVFRLLSPITPVSVTKGQNYFRAGNESDANAELGEDHQPAKAPYEERGSEGWRKLYEKASLEIQERGVQLPTWSLPLNRMIAYTIAYQAVDRVQDEFPVSAVGPIMALNLDLLSRRYLTGIPAPPVIFGCQQAKDHWLVNFEKENWNTNCTKRLAIRTSDANGLLYGLRAASPAFGQIVMPLNSLFLTSLTITGLIYGFTIFLFISKLLSRWLLGGVASLEAYFLRGPLSCVGFGMGALVVLIYVWQGAL